MSGLAQTPGQKPALFAVQGNEIDQPGECCWVRRGPSPHRLSASAEGTNPTAEEEGGDRGRRVLEFFPLHLFFQRSAAVHQIYGFADRYTITEH